MDKSFYLLCSDTFLFLFDDGFLYSISLLVKNKAGCGDLVAEARDLVEQQQPVEQSPSGSTDPDHICCIGGGLRGGF